MHHQLNIFYINCIKKCFEKKFLVGRLENLRDMPMPCHLFWHSSLPTHTFSNVIGTERSILFLSCEQQQHTSETSQVPILYCRKSKWIKDRIAGIFVYLSSSMHLFLSSIFCCKMYGDTLYWSGLCGVIKIFSF